MEATRTVCLWIITVLIIASFIELFVERTDINPKHPCNWYGNSYIATSPMRCISYWEKQP